MSAEIEVREYAVRCAGDLPKTKNKCKHLLTKIRIYTSFSDEIKTLMEKMNLPLSQAIKGIEVKVGIQTKCRVCKAMDHKIIVI